MNYKEEVKKVYADAFCDSGDVDDYTSTYWITTPDKDAIAESIGDDENGSPHLAWESAYKAIKTKGEIK